jgi:tetratricopeptide (TPR) repeat protein
LMPHQLYVLAVGYVRKGENEQAAVILSNLVNLKDDKSYQRAEVYLLAGISWYRLKHYQLAIDFFEKSEKDAKHESAVYRQTMVWMAMAQRDKGDRVRSQLTLLKLMDEFPHAEEVKWFNEGVQDDMPVAEKDVTPEAAPAEKTAENAAVKTDVHAAQTEEMKQESHDAVTNHIDDSHREPAATEHHEEKNDHSHSAGGHQ